MKSDLTPHEQHYINQIMDILKSSGVKPSYREDARIQLIEHARESRIHDEDFREDLGSPEDFALHFMDTAVTKEDQGLNRSYVNYSNPQNKKAFSLKSPLLFVFLATLYYGCLQFFTVLIFTPVLAPGYGYQFHMFVISDSLWWNLLVTVINISIALLLSGVSMYFLNKRYRLS